GEGAKCRYRHIPRGTTPRRGDVRDGEREARSGPAVLATTPAPVSFQRKEHAMQSTAKRRQVKGECRISRQVILLRLITANVPGLIEVTASGTTSRYTVRRMKSQIGGRAFELSKVGAGPDDDGPYHVLVNGNNSHCPCRGNARF